jgi:hypothetical protein
MDDAAIKPATEPKKKTPLELLLETKTLDDYKGKIKELKQIQFQDMTEWGAAFDHYEKLSTKKCKEESKSPLQFMECKKKSLDELELT